MSGTRCTAKSKRSGEQCKRWAMVGGTVCAMHGGKSPQAMAAAARRVERAKLEGSVAELMDRLGVEQLAGRPYHEDLALALRVCRARVIVLEHVTGELHTSGGERSGGATWWGRNHLGDGAMHVLEGELRSWTAELARVSKAAIDAGVEERQVRLEEAQFRLVGDMIRIGIDGAMALFHEESPPQVWEAMGPRLAEELPRIFARAIERAAVVDVEEAA